MEVALKPSPLRVAGGDDPRSGGAHLQKLGLDLGLEPGVIRGERLDPQVGRGIRPAAGAEPEDEPTKVPNGKVQALDGSLQLHPDRRISQGRSERFEVEGDAEEEQDDALMELASDPVALDRQRRHMQIVSYTLELERDRRLHPIGFDEPDLDVGERQRTVRTADRHCPNRRPRTSIGTATNGPIRALMAGSARRGDVDIPR